MQDFNHDYCTYSLSISSIFKIYGAIDVHDYFDNYDDTHV